mmetsp:Transcript_47038/g.73619  ORF Transcript_47038/g.73619 Transcript_47038/m.73619 type:complete len:83 (-) Transcript_47038:170-418(-)
MPPPSPPAPATKGTGFDPFPQCRLAHKSDVDKFADEAMKGSGNAKKAAIARMRALQKQIENDYKHVTKFAVTQEYALPPVKK